MTGEELQDFFEYLTQELRTRSVLCAITSGLACVHYGVAETTKDCDLLCHPNCFDKLLEFLEKTRIENAPCRYRGNISPPLDARWRQGGWTSHFEWLTRPEAVLLNVFGRALRESSPWERELAGLYAAPQTVAEMKRTQRDKDWPFITALGLRMIDAGDDRGWLHIFASDTLIELLKRIACPAEIAARRPALQFALNADPRTAGALNAERKLCEELDHKRIQMLEAHLRPYVSAVRKARAASKKDLPLLDDHELRIDCATRHLPRNPLKDYGLAKYIDECKSALVSSGIIPEIALTWLPDVAIYFRWL